MEALGDTASYVRQRQEIDAENLKKLQEGLAKSRDRLLADLDSLFMGGANMELEKVLNQVHVITNDCVMI